MAKMGFSSWLLVVAVVSQGVWCRPPVREVKLITQPSPGQEFVSIQSSVFSQKAVRTPPSQPGTQEEEGDFATSHKIPGQLPVDEPEDEEEVDVSKPLELPAKSKRADVEALATLQGAILTPDLLPLAEEHSTPKTEFRMEFSVVTSKPRKEVKEYKDKSVLVSKVAVNSKKVAVKSVDKEDDVPEFEVEVDSKGNFGKLDAGLTGSDEKKVMAKKQSAAAAAAASAGKESVKGQDQILKEVEINPASEVGVKSREVASEVGAITVPVQKQQSVRYGDNIATVSPAVHAHAPSIEKGYDILPVNLVKNTDKIKEKDFDFVDSPLADKVLVPAGSNQQSRIEVKKGPNGQDYEYEYVYYYYDDDEDANISDKKQAGAKSSTSAPTTTTTEAPTTSRQHHSEVHHEGADHARVRGRTRAPPTAATEEEVGARNKYASIERTAAPAAPATPDASNEIIPARGSSARSRGRTVTTEEPSTVSAEERLPANTRFPPRSRSNHNSNSIAATTPAAAPQETAAPAAAAAAPAPRVRGGSVRRPSLELVDSSSFKTQSSDASRDQDLRPEFPASLPAANEEEEVEEVVKPSRGSRVRGHTSTAAPEVVEEEEEDDSDAPRRGQPRRPVVEDEDEDVVEDSNAATEPAAANPSSGVVGTTTKAEDVGLTQAAMDKAAIELYSLFQQAQAENSIEEESTDLSAEEVTTELEEVTTTQETTTVPPTTTTTTTVAPTTTTTEATTTAATGRGRYRPRGGNAGATGTKSRFRGNKEEATSTTTETPAETSTKARRFGGNRATSGTYGRRGFSKATTTHPEEHSDSDKEEAVKEVAKVESAAPAVRAGGFSRNRFSAGRTSRVTTSTTASPTPSEDSAPSSPSSSAPNKPAFADRFNSLRRRGGLKQSTTVAPLNEETKSESSGEETNEPSTVSDAPATTAKPLGRTRLSIGSGPRPLRPGPRVNIGARGRLGASTTTAAPSTEVDEGSNEQTSSSSQDEAQSHSDEAQEVVTTPVPDALTRLRNRPRLRVNAAKQAATTAASVVRRPLGLLPRRRQHPAEVKEASESESQDSSNASSNSEESEVSGSSEETSEASTDATSSAATVQEPAQENNRLSSLLAGRRRGSNALRRQRNLFPSGPKQAQAEGSS